MEGFLKLSTSVGVTILMIDDADHISGQIGLSGSLTIYASKAGGTPSLITPAVTELDDSATPGIYALTLTTSHTNTLGELELHITAPNADPADYKWFVTTYLPGEAATVQSGTGSGQLNISSGIVDADVQQWLSVAPASLSSSGFVKTMFMRWLTDNAAGTPVALSSNGLVQTLLTKWLSDDSTGIPLPLSDSGLVQTLLLQWLSDDSTGEPLSLVDGRVEVHVPTTVSVRSVPSYIDIPLTGTRTFRIELFIYDELGSMTTPDSAPTLTLTNQTGTDRSGRLDSTTMALVETGRYRVVYTSTSTDVSEELLWTFSVIVNSTTKKYGDVSVLRSIAEGVFSDEDRDNLTSILNRVGAFAGSGYNTVLGFFRALMRTDAPLPSDVEGSYTTTMAMQGLYNKVIYIPESFGRNVAFDNFKFVLRLSADHITPAVGITSTVAQRSLDSGSFALCANSVIEIGNGVYRINLTAGDLDGDSIMLYFSALNCDPVYVSIKTA